MWPRDVAWVLASGATWTFTIALALYAYYEEGPAGVGLAVAVRVLPAALVAPRARTLVDRTPARYVLAASAAARALGLAGIALCVALDLPLVVVLALVAAFRVAGAADRWAYAALDPRFDGTPMALRRAEVSRRRLDEVGFLAGALVAGVCVSVAGLDVVFAICAGAFVAAAAVALRSPAGAPSPRSEESMAGARVALERIDARRLLLARGGPAAARAVVELLLVIAAIDVLGMGDGGVGWLSAAWAVGLVAGTRVLRARGQTPSVRTVGTSCALAGAPLALLALAPPPAVALVLLTVLGLGFALAREAERAVEHRCPPGAPLDGGQIVDALARTAGSMVAASLVLLLGAEAALAAAGALVTALGLVAVGAFQGGAEEEPAARVAAVPQGP
ncbi:MAG: Transrane secretion effector [Thermoleophilaceae bacterium]|nr:Transrane secretion effector [Thermoleophilaceae bacterium]